jgi:hypothetical protein
MTVFFEGGASRRRGCLDVRVAGAGRWGQILTHDNAK